MGTGIHVVREEGVEERIFLNQAMAKYCRDLASLGHLPFLLLSPLVVRILYCPNDSMQL